MKSPNIDPEFTLQMRKDIGARIMEIREARGLSRNDVALLIGVKIETISKIEHGTMPYRIEDLFILAIALEFEINLVLK